MEPGAFLDTHVAVWLYAGEERLVSPAAKAVLATCALWVSPMVELELQFLYERGRILVESEPILRALRQDLGLQVCELPFRDVVTRAGKETWTRDPFDRLISSQALCREWPLLTKDRTILEHCPVALW